MSTNGNGVNGRSNGTGQRSILITGCSSGIGYDAAHALKNKGWRVFATCRKEEDCVRLRDEGLESFRLDYQDGESIASAADEALSRTGGTLDALFNNGAYAQPGATEDIPTDALRALFEANFFGWHDLTRRVLPAMRRQGHGRIIQCSSILGFITLKYRGPYNASKFALEGLSDTLRLELRGSGIHVVLIEPGPIATKIRENSRAHFYKWIDWENSVWRPLYESKLMPRIDAKDAAPDPFQLPASAVTAKLIHALESPRPRPRYYVTTPTYMMGVLKRGLPTRMLDKVLNKASG